MHLDTLSTKIRLTAEVLMEIAATLYIFAALREARFLGLNMFIENLVRQSNDGDIYNEILTKEMIFLDDRTVQSNVSLFLLYIVNLPIFKIDLRRPSWRYVSRCRYVNHGTVFFIFLQRFQNGRSIRRDDLQNDHGRSAPFRLHLLGLRDGIFPR